MRLLATAVDACTSITHIQTLTRAPRPPSTPAYITAAGRCCMSGAQSCQQPQRLRMVHRHGHKARQGPAAQVNLGHGHTASSTRGCNEYASQSEQNQPERSHYQAQAWERMPAMRVVSQAACIAPAVSCSWLVHQCDLHHRVAASRAWWCHPAFGSMHSTATERARCCPECEAVHGTVLHCTCTHDQTKPPAGFAILGQWGKVSDPFMG